MKNYLTLLSAMLLFILTARAQAPQFIPWQAVVRDTSWNPLPNQFVSFRFTVHTGSSTGTVVYKETDTVTTNKLGMVNLQIGSGTVVTGTFSGINWSSGSEYLQVELDPTGGTSYTTMGSPQMMSVPYALFSGGNAGSAQPTGQITYGNGAATTSDANFLHDSATGQTVIITTSQEYTEVAVDSDFLFAGHWNAARNKICILEVGNAMATGTDSMTFFGGVVVNGSNQIIYGINAVADSVQMIATDGNTNGGVVGVQYYSAYLDAMYENGNMLNSLTVDTDGLHWEHGNSDVYTFPNTSGAAGQVLTTNGAGNLGWSTTNLSGNAIFTPATGATITAIWGTNIINPSSGLTALTITLPSSPVDNETVFFTFTNTITTITFSGGTVAGPLSTVSSVSNGSVKYWLTYNAGSSTWF